MSYISIVLRGLQFDTRGSDEKVFGERLKEHQRDVKERKESSVLHAHCCKHRHHMDWDSTSILDRERMWLPRLISEIVNIHLQVEHLIALMIPECWLDNTTNCCAKSNIYNFYM